MNFKKISSLTLSTVLLVTLLTGCQTNIPALTNAFEKTNSATAVKMDFEMAVSVEGVSIGTITGVSKSSTNKDGTVGQAYSSATVDMLGETATAECFMDMDVSDATNPLIKAAVKIPDLAKEDLGGADYFVLDTTKLDSDYFASIGTDSFDDISATLNSLLAKAAGEFVWEKVNDSYKLQINQEQIDKFIDAIADVVGGQSIINEVIDIGKDGINVDVKLDKSGYVSEVDFSVDLSELIGQSGAVLSGTMKYSDYNKPFTVTMPATNADNSLDVIELMDTCDVQIYMNGKKLLLPSDSTPFVTDGRTMVPARYLVEKLGGTIEYGAPAGVQVVSAVIDGTKLDLIIGNTTAYVNDAPVELDVPAIIVEDRTRIPLRFVSENFGKDVTYFYKNVLNREILVININDK